MMDVVGDSIHDRSTERCLIGKSRNWEIGKLVSLDLNEWKLQVQQIDELFQTLLYRSHQLLLMMIIIFLEAARIKTKEL